MSGYATYRDLTDLIFHFFEHGVHLGFKLFRTSRIQGLLDSIDISSMEESVSSGNVNALGGEVFVLPLGKRNAHESLATRLNIFIDRAERDGSKSNDWDVELY
jgi:hypothetical protein